MQVTLGPLRITIEISRPYPIVRKMREIAKAEGKYAAVRYYQNTTGCPPFVALEKYAELCGSMEAAKR